MSYEKIFRTEGSEYLRDPNTGLWIRLGRDSPPAFYIGSIDSKKNDVFIDQNRYNLHKLLAQIYRSHDPGFTERENVPGFIPTFDVGNAPIGVFCRLEEILEVEEGRIKLKIGGFNIHVGRSIAEIYKSLPYFMEQNLANNLLI